VDVYSRRILGWRVATSMRPFLVTDALRQAVDVRHRAGARWERGRLVHHSDADSQYTSVTLTAELAQAGIAGSIGTVGDALDNALCESAIGLFKTEAINDGGPTWKNHAEVEWQVARWVHWYNHQRLHSSIGHLPPIEFERSPPAGYDRDPDPGGRVTNHPPEDPGRFNVLWYKDNKTDLVRLIIVRDPHGPDDYFFTTDRTATGAGVASHYGDRWASEVCFRDVKQHLGGQDPQSWKRQGPGRAAALSLWLHAATRCWCITT
jgi:hypothetical protein